MGSAILSKFGRAGVAGALQGISIGGPVNWLGDASLGREMQVNCYRDDSDGNPAGTPSLRMDHWGFWRFQWVLAIGANSWSISVKQALNETPRPSVVIKANPDVGLVVDSETVAAAGNSWETITVAPNATAAGAVWVELHNRLDTEIYCPCLWSGFDAWGPNGVPVIGGGGGSAPAATAKTHLVSPRQERLRSP